MFILFVFAFVSGIITILSPCILPMLPIILAGGTGGKRTRAFGIVTGFVFSFTLFTLALTALVQAFGIAPDSLRIFAVLIIIGFGLVLVLPPLQRWFEVLASKLTGMVQGTGGRQASSPHRTGFAGLASGLPVGISLGLVWTPCVGPIMASVISLALTESLDSGAIFITLAYAMGTALPMLLIMLTGRRLLNRVPFLVRHTEQVRKIFGILMVLTGLAIGFNWDRQLQATLLRIFPSYGTGLTSLENLGVVEEALQERERQNRTPSVTSGLENLPAFSLIDQPGDGVLRDYGMAPEIVTSGPWLNTERAYTMQELRGKVVLIDFWTYSCINCIRTMPWLKAWYERYRDDGLVIIGVHTPEFEFEKDIANVSQAMQDLGVTWPVVLDNEYRQWRAYGNHYWPAHFFIDMQGRIRYYRFGEGHYETSEQVMRDLLAEGGNKTETEQALPPPSRNAARTAETYLGYARQTGFLPEAGLDRDKVAAYYPAEKLGNGHWTLAGHWLATAEHIETADQEQSTLKLRFHAKKVFLVIEPTEAGGNITVILDGKKVRHTADITDGLLVPTASRLYELVDLPQSGSHLLELEVRGQIRLFAFTFG